MPNPGNANRLRFGKFLVDLASGELSCEGVKVGLQEKPFQILALLLRRPKELVTRNEIIHTVWPDTFVEADLCLNVAIRRLRTALKDDAAQPQFVETVGSHGYRFIAPVHALTTSVVAPSSRDRPRLAVFPLKSFVGSNNESLAPSMTEQIIIHLRRSDSVPVIITPEFTTERTPKGRSMVTLCRQVSADYVLVGAVSEIAGEIRVTARLLNCHAQSCVWAESYAMAGNIAFANQEETSRNIAEAVAHSIAIPPRSTQLQLVEPAAQENYLQGCSLLSMLTEAAVEKSVALFEDVVRQCPQLAIGWTGLANAHFARARLGVVPPRKAFPEIKRCAEKALQMEDLAEARTALANYRLFYEHEFHAAEAELVRALEIDPRCPLALAAYAQLLTVVGRHGDAIAMIRHGCDLDPFCGYTRITLGSALHYAGENEAALLQLRHGIGLDPSLWVGHTLLGKVLEQIGKMQDAVGEFRIAVERSDNSALARAHLAYGLARLGEKAGSTEILESLLKLKHKKYFSSYWIAVIYMGLEEPSEALKWLENAQTEHCCWLVFAAADPKFAALRADPRFQQITERSKGALPTGPITPYKETIESN
jgi:DNA-binding winged helix-turn-helix (wHTH) protein/tetratricopeptide (TPR) repeat protein